MPTSLATWRSDSATRLLSSQSRSAASRIARRVRSLRSPRVSVTCILVGERVSTLTMPDP